MKFEWDKRKAATNVTKHGVSFKDAEGVFKDHSRLEYPQRVNREDRWFTIGHNGSKILVVVYTETTRGTRIISAREATNDEKKRYRRR